MRRRLAVVLPAGAPGQPTTPSRRGNDRSANVSRDQLDPLLRQLRGVDEDDEDLLAFLGGLSDGSFIVRPPTCAERACG